MIVVLSDLHFSEAQSTQIGPFEFNRNLAAEKYRAYFSEINQFSTANQVEEIDLVLAGDIFEISRSSIWLEGNERPYVNNTDVLPGSEAEQVVLKIIRAIAQEDKVAQTLVLFRDISTFFDCKVKLHLILGNHDRLANATPDIRNEVRDLLGLEGGSELFGHHVLFHDDGKPFCLIRHGHEYDPTNISLDVRELNTIPVEIPESVYGKASLGDIISVEYGAALPWLFVKEYGESTIIQNETLMAIYLRLMDFDDVRPTTAWLSYLFSTPGVSVKETWHYMKPCFTKIINTLSQNESFNKTLKETEAINNLMRVVIMGALKLGLFKRGIPYWLIKSIMKRVSKTIDLKSQVRWAKRESLILDEDSGCRCVVSGHTHFAEVALISAKYQRERYYINTGTWRNVIPATKDYADFGRLKALTKVIIYYPNECTELEPGKDWAFHFMSGVSFGDQRLL